MIIHGKKELNKLQEALEIVKSSYYFGFSEEEELEAFSKLQNPNIIDNFIKRINISFGIRRGIIDEIMDSNSSHQDKTLSIAVKKAQMLELILLKEGKIQKKLTQAEFKVLAEVMIYYSFLDIERSKEMSDFYFYKFDLDEEVDENVFN